MLTAYKVVDFALVALVGNGVDMTVLLAVLAHTIVVDIVVCMLLLVEHKLVVVVEHKLVVVVEHRPFVVVVVDYIAVFVSIDAVVKVVDSDIGNTVAPAFAIELAVAVAVKVVFVVAAVVVVLFVLVALVGLAAAAMALLVGTAATVDDVVVAVVVVVVVVAFASVVEIGRAHV